MAAKVYKSTTDTTQTKLLDGASSQDRISPHSIFAQCSIAGAVMLSAASCGMPIGYSAILLPQLKITNTSLHINDEIGSWIASVHSAATPLGALFSGFLMQHFGRKSALQLSALPLIIGWLLISFAHNHALILAGRLIAGMSSGLCAAPGQVLIGETAEPHLRGVLSSIPIVSYSFGILLVYAMGSLLDWRLVAGLSTLLPLCAVALFCFLPESPVWLVQRGRDQDAKSALIWLRGGDTLQAKQELQDLLTRQETNGHDSPQLPCWRLLLQPCCLKPFVIVNVFNAMQVLSGTYLIVLYAVDLLANVDLNAFGAAVLTAGVRFVFTIMATLLLAIVGRRPLALTSGFGTALAAIMVAVAPTNLYPLITVGVFVYVACNTVGFMILPSVLISELFAVRVRAFAGGLTFALFNVLLFAVAKCFPIVHRLLGVHGVFYLFAGSSALASIFLYVFLPETKGKTLAEIEDYFNTPGFLWKEKSNVKEVE